MMGTPFGGGAFGQYAATIAAAVLAFKDATVRFSLRAGAFRDVLTRFSLRATKFRDVVTRFSLRAGAFRDTGFRLVLRVLGQMTAPVSDALNEGWTDQGGGSTTIYVSIDEVAPDDSDYIQSPPSPSGQRYRANLAALDDPAVSGGHQVSYRIGKDNASQAIDLTVRLFQGGTQIASWVEPDIPATLSTYRRLLSPTEADAITDYAALALEFEAIVA